jgi:hypothetical protein
MTMPVIEEDPTTAAKMMRIVGVSNMIPSARPALASLFALGEQSLCEVHTLV